MLANERQSRILEWLDSRDTIKVSELGDLLGGSTETVRQDLNKLESAGRVKRVHGGVCSITIQSDEPYYEREILNVDSKTEIAKEAVHHIEPYEQIILDASSTCLFVAKHLQNIPLTVLTNSLRIAYELSGKDRIDVVLLGGSLLRRSMSFIGQSTHKMVDMYRVGKAFISSKGVHYQHGISEANEPTALVKQRMMQIAKETILLVDHSKFGKSSLIQIDGLDSINKIITDSRTAQEDIIELREHASKVIKSSL